MSRLKDEQLAILAKEKRRAEEEAARLAEGLREAEDRCGVLAQVKAELERELVGAEEAVGRERRERGEMDKGRRRLEAELKGRFLLRL